MTTDNKTLADAQPGGRVRLGTPGARWAATGEPDPHGTRYDCERSELAMGNLSDDELANAVFIHGDRNLTFAQMTSGELPGSAYLAAAKDRIRWLSRALVAAEALSAQPSPGETLPPEMRLGSADYLDYLDGEPSPGGQGASFPWENFPAYLIDKCEGDTISEEGLQHALAAMAKDERYCTPARQPVGEPAMYQVRPRSFDDGEGWRQVTKRQFDDRGEFPGYPEAEWERRTLYAAPPAQQPAQAVDLADFKALYRAYVRLLDSGRDRIRDLGGACDPVDVMEANDVDLQAARRVLDSQAVGK